MKRHILRHMQYLLVKIQQFAMYCAFDHMKLVDKRPTRRCKLNSVVGCMFSGKMEPSICFKMDKTFFLFNRELGLRRMWVIPYNPRRLLEAYSEVTYKEELNNTVFQLVAKEFRHSWALKAVWILKFYPCIFIVFFLDNSKIVWVSVCIQIWWKSEVIDYFSVSPFFVLRWRPKKVFQWITSILNHLNIYFWTVAFENASLVWHYICSMPWWVIFSWKIKTTLELFEIIFTIPCWFNLLEHTQPTSYLSIKHSFKLLKSSFHTFILYEYVFAYIIY